jgi:hypothetical protein
VFLAGGGPSRPVPIVCDVKEPLNGDRETSLSAMACSPYDRAPDRGDHFHSVSTVIAESAIVIRQILHVFIGEPEKSPVDCGHNAPKCIFRAGNALTALPQMSPATTSQMRKKTAIYLLSPFRAIQYGVWWCGVNAPPRSELEVVGRLDEEQPASAGGLVEE